MGSQARNTLLSQIGGEPAKKSGKFDTFLFGWRTVRFPTPELTPVHHVGRVITAMLERNDRFERRNPRYKPATQPYIDNSIVVCRMV